MRIKKIATAVMIIALAAYPAVMTARAGAPRETITPAFHYSIANVPGKTIIGIVVSYPPGGKTPPHRHGSAFVVGYILSGSIRSQIDGGKVQVFNAGQSWTENPGAHHMVSENASEINAAKLRAIFVADSSDNQLVTFDSK